MNVTSPMVDILLRRQLQQKHLILYFTEKTVIAKTLDSKFSNDKKKKLLTWRNTKLRKVKSYIDNNPNPAKENVIDPIKDNLISH